MPVPLQLSKLSRTCISALRSLKNVRGYIPNQLQNACFMLSILPPTKRLKTRNRADYYSLLNALWTTKLSRLKPGILKLIGYIPFILLTGLVSCASVHQGSELGKKKTHKQRTHHFKRTRHITKAPESDKPYIHHVHKNVADFDKLLIDGNIDVELHSGYTKPSLVIQGDRRDLSALMTKVENHTLVLYAGAGVPDYAPVKIIVKGRYIHAIKTKNNASVTGHALKLNYLDLDLNSRGSTHLGGYLCVHKVHITGPGAVRLDDVYSKDLRVSLRDNANLKINGKANLTYLDAKDHSQFTMLWLNSETLKANVSGDVYIQLAGVVNKLDACVYGKAHWNGRYLRSRRTYMKTFGQAIARIAAEKKQHTLALDQSNIYYYNLPTYKTDFMAYDGSVLDMRSWQLRAKQDFDKYNKAS